MARLDNLDYEVNGSTVNYEIVPEIAPLFNATIAYAAGDQVIYECIRYKFTTAHPAGAWIGTDAEEMPTVAEELTSHDAGITQLKADFTQLDETAAKIDGSYDTMTVGNAKQLTSNVGINDKAPYLFRTAGGANDIGDREEDTIAGGTIVWNQRENDGTTSNGIKATKGDDGIFTLTGTASATWSNFLSSMPLNAGHRYIATHRILANPNNLPITFNADNGVSSKIHSQNGFIFTASNSGTVGMGASDLTNGEDYSGVKFYFNLVDITAMFGTTAIADYIYSLESATAGSGIAWLRKYGFFTKDYYPYSEPTFKHVEGLTAHRIVGLNQWNEEWESGSFNSSTGEPITNADWSRSSNYIKVVPGSTYHFEIEGMSDSNGAYAFIYDANKNFLSYENLVTNNDRLMPSNAGFIRIQYKRAIGAVANYKVCIHLHWDSERDGEYEAYKEYTYPLDSNVVLRGIPKLDANNDLYYDGDTYEADGTVTRKYGIVDLGTLTWSNIGSDKLFSTRGINTSIRKASSGGELFTWGITTKALKSYTYNTIQANTPYAIAVSTIGSVLATLDTDTTYSASDFKAAMSGVYLVYELATQTTETADPFQTPQVVDDWGTEEYVYTGGAFPIPVGHDTFYAANLKAKLEMAPDSPGDGDGDYIVRQTNGLNEYVKMVKELPSAPTTDGSYHLEVTVASGTPTLTWVADE